MPALAIASWKPRLPAILKLISDESTGWCLPSKHVTRTSTTGNPCTPPRAIASCTPFSTAGMNWRGMTPPTIASTNSNPSPAPERLDPQHGDAELAVAAGLLLVATLGLGGGGDGLPVGDLHLLGLDRGPELALQSLDRDRGVGLAHRPQHRLVGLGVALDPDRGVLVLEAVERVGELVLVALALGPDGDGKHR